LMIAGGLSFRPEPGAAARAGRWISPGSIFAAVTWIAASLFFPGTRRASASCNEAYGSWCGGRLCSIKLGIAGTGYRQPFGFMLDPDLHHGHPDRRQALLDGAHVRLRHVFLQVGFRRCSTGPPASAAACFSFSALSKRSTELSSRLKNAIAISSRIAIISKSDARFT
jgi:hypothetical protein